MTLLPSWPAQTCSSVCMPGEWFRIASCTVLGAFTDQHTCLPGHLLCTGVGWQSGLQQAVFVLPCGGCTSGMLPWLMLYLSIRAAFPRASEGQVRALSWVLHHEAGADK